MRRAWSLRARLLLSLAYVLVLAVVSLGVPLAISLRDRVDAEVHSQALSQADVVAATSADLFGSAVGGSGVATGQTGVTGTGAHTSATGKSAGAAAAGAANTMALSAVAHSSAATVRGRVLIVDSRGRVLADSAGSSTLHANYRTRPEIAAALRGSSVQTQRQSRTLGESILATAVPVVRGGRTIGAVRVTQSVAAVQRAVDSTIAKLALVAGTVLLLGLLAGALIARQVALPLRRLEAAAKRVEGGDLSARATVEGSSEQRSLALSFNEMAGRVQRLLSAQREFVADASHQLRTPLTALRLRMGEARAAGVSDAASAELDAGAAEIDRLAAMVDELLVLSRAEDRQSVPERIDLREAARRAAERWRIAAHTEGIELSVLDEGGVTVACSPADLDRALDALVENAVRYSPAGSEVTISSAGARIEVRDRGPGLAPGEEREVFERFHRGHAGRQGPAGSGLGLATARALARGWHGDARLRNREGGGAVGTLEFKEASS